MTAGDGGWLLEWRWAGAGVLHADWPPTDRVARRVAAVCTVTGDAALVLGSTQSDTVVDRARLAASAVGLVRRRSGGGAVLVAPGAQVWIDVWIPRQDPLWDDDVIRSSQWLGDVWAAALGALGAADVSVHRGRAQGGPWCDTICFAGLGPGEVTAGGRKVVGLSQRRTRDGARLHTMAPLTWDPAALLAVLAVDDEQRSQAALETAEAAVGLCELLDLSGGADPVEALHAVESAVLERLPDGEGGEQHH